VGETSDDLDSILYDAVLGAALQLNDEP